MACHVMCAPPVGPAGDLRVCILRMENDVTG